MNEDIEEIKKHKLEQYASQAQATQQEKVSAEYDAKKLAILRQIFTPDVRERINVLRDAKLKSLLFQLQPKKREIQIRRI